MKRRDFMKAVGASAVGAQAGCVTLPPRRDERLSVERLDAFLAQYDQGLSSIDRGGGLPVFGDPGGDDGARGEAMARRAFRSLYAVGAFADLDIEEQAHPGVQARLARMLPEMTESLRECTAFLEATIPGKDSLHVRQALEADPSLPLQLAEVVDAAGEAAGVSARTRRKFRVAATQVGFRLRHHGSAMLAGEYVTKVRKIEAWSGDQARLQRQIAARVGEASLFEKQARFAAAQERWAAVLAREQVSGGFDDEPSRPWSGPLRAAAWAFGIGVVAGGVGALVVSSGDITGAFAITVGAVALIVALVLLMVAGVRYASSRSRDDEAETDEAVPSAALDPRPDETGPPGEK